MIRRTLLALAIVTGVAAVALLPPGALSITPSASTPPVLRGAMHVHTTNSDGSGTPDAVAAAAARAGLKFVILTDHGDATRTPDRPQYRSGVLMIDAVEVSTSGGHVIALDLPKAPYPLRGEPDDVLEDLQRLGAMAIVAHPTSLKADLAWRGSTDPGGRPFDGVEWLNGDSEWRDERFWSLSRILFTYWFRAPESLALILDRPETALTLWDRVARTHNVVGLSGSDAHAKIGGDLDHGGPAAVHLPSYEQVFRTFSLGLPGVVPSGNAPADARAVIAAIRAGHVFTAIDAFAQPARLAFTATGAGVAAQAGDRVAAGVPLALHAELDAPELPPTLTLYRGGNVAAMATGGRLDYQADGTPAVYRVEATLPARRGGGPLAPWLVSNPIYVGPAVPWVAPAPPAPVASKVVYRDGPSSLTVEHSDRSAGAVTVVGAEGGMQLSLRFALGGKLSDAPFVAFASGAPEIAGYTAVSFTGRAGRPMRISVQLRASEAQGSGRWRTSVYLDEVSRTVTLSFSAFRPTGNGSAPVPPLDAIGSLLLVIDTMNTALGSNGEFWIDDLAFVR
ncbi:MAG TPA: CehA/McbA family metallohydrolase [Vicinamibacterales bacterium]|nr:CehA/McbA family metallohydrolase [Vicinamibacterales bacterium]